MKVGTPKNKKKPKSLRIVMLAVPPVTGLDIIGPAEVFASANRLLGKKGPGYVIELATTGDDLFISGQSGLAIVAHRHYSRIDPEMDTLLVMGGPNARKTCGAPVFEWLRQIAPGVRRMGSVCTGALLLAEAGLLNGRHATTHWLYTHELAADFKQINVDANPIWIRDGHLYTSAGVTSGMDLALAMVEEDYGGRLALETARFLVLFLRRPGGQAQFSEALSSQTPRSPFLDKLQAWILKNLSAPLSVEILAERAAMSPRNFARVFNRDMGITPARYILQLRLEAARKSLEQTDTSIEQIAGDCGFGSVEVLRRSFLRHLGTSPALYRDRFRHSGQEQEEIS